MSIQAFPYPIFQPAIRIISAITNSNPAQVTTTFAHQYITGTIVRLDIPLGFGMQQANQAFGPIYVTSSTTFTIPIDTTLYDVFSAPSEFPLNYQYAQSVPMAEDNSILTAAVQNVLPYKAT
ncbi:MAG TPA: hypothetical protein VHA52_02320 [Candidatus Babeliaceae bacterium]|nr:hypothetical protein [Candidatus Babeliaceae bacterium]